LIKSQVGEKLTHGGSGGFIYINLTSESGMIALYSSAKIESVGGHGINNGYSGSGGRIVV
jgi:hypothetical protein